MPLFPILSYEVDQVNNGEDDLSTSLERSSFSVTEQVVDEPLRILSNGRPNENSTQNCNSSSVMRETTDHGHGHEIPSNERLLGTAFFSFMTFALTQLTFAFAAGSEAMVGDSAAMIVDSVTYLFNWIAERRKNRYDEFVDSSLHAEADPVTTARIRQRNKRKLILRLEIIPPVISVTTLVIVTIVVTRKAVHVLQLDMHRTREEQLIPNLNVMLAFSMVNLILDCVNVFNFAKANHLMGYVTIEEGTDTYSEHEHLSCPGSTKGKIIARVQGGLNDNSLAGADQQKQLKRDYEQVPIGTVLGSSKEDGEDDVEAYANDSFHGQQSAELNAANDYDYDNNREHSNLNMCSAYTHVFADTLRSIAVIVAAILAEIIPDVTPEEADATAAVVVSVLIVFSLIPLIQGLLRSVAELRVIAADERYEDNMLLRSQAANFELT